MLAFLYFFVPLYGTFDFSLRMKRGQLTLAAYQVVLSDPEFLESFRYSAVMGVVTIVISVLLFVPTVYWIYLKLPKVRPVMEIITILPFMIPVIVYVFGLIRTFGGPPFQLTLSPFRTDLLIAAAYVIISMPYMFRAIDVGMRTIDVRTLTEAAQSLGSNWFQILTNIIFPNLRIAILSGGPHLLCYRDGGVDSGRFPGPPGVGTVYGKHWPDKGIRTGCPGNYQLCPYLVQPGFNPIFQPGEGNPASHRALKGLMEY